MKKTSKMTLCIGVALMIGVILGQNIPKQSLSNNNTKRQTIAMYIENEEGGYDLSSQNKFPTEGYVLNTEKSSCKNGGTLSQDPTTKKLSLSVSNSDQCTVYFDKEVATSSVSTLLTNANDVSVTDYSSGNQQEMFAFDHDEATQTTGWTAEERRDYRYIGNNPNNYITFNDETWRIIGVFTVETEDGSKEQLMKIIRNKSIGNLKWASNNVNEWSTSSLKTLLNGDYYNQSGGYTNSVSVKGLSETARNQVANVKWYLGGSSTYEGLGGPNYYSFERGETVYSGRSTNIVAKVGLMYPSDYVYTYANGVNSKCYSDGYNCDKGTPSAGWLFNSDYQWTISPRADLSRSAFHVGSTGYVSFVTVFNTYGVRPSVYLKSNIQIKSGTGASSDPYTIG